MNQFVRIMQLVLQTILCIVVLTKCFVFVIILGLIFPALLESIELLGFKVPVVIPALLILIGGLLFRMVMIEAGQLTRYLY